MGCKAGSGGKTAEEGGESRREALACHGLDFSKHVSCSEMKLSKIEEANHKITVFQLPLQDTEAAEKSLPFQPLMDRVSPVLRAAGDL